MLMRKHGKTEVKQRWLVHRAVEWDTPVQQGVPSAQELERSAMGSAAAAVMEPAPCAQSADDQTADPN